MKVKEILGRVFYIIAAVCVFLHVVILSLSFFDNNQQEKYCRSVIPDREYQTDEDNRRFVFSAQEIKDGENCLRFYTAHMEVSVYADDTLIYHVGQQAMPKVSPGVVWNYVEIPSFVWFTKGFFDIEDKWGSDIICTLAYLDLAVQLILQLTGICSLRQICCTFIMDHFRQVYMACMAFLSISAFLRSKYVDRWWSRWMQGGSCRSMKNLQQKIC